MKSTHLEKIIAVERILQTNPNGITLKQIINQLYDRYGITAERKSIYNNINALTRFMPIHTEIRANNKVFYCLDKRSDTNDR